MDDVISGAGSVKNGFIFYKVAKNIMLEAGFTLRKWVSSNLELQQLIKRRVFSLDVALADVNKFSYADYQFFSKSSDNGCKKVLGMNWNVVTDEFYTQLLWLKGHSLQREIF